MAGSATRLKGNRALSLDLRGFLEREAGVAGWKKPLFSGSLFPGPVSAERCPVKLGPWAAGALVGFQIRELISSASNVPRMRPSKREMADGPGGFAKSRPVEEAYAVQQR